MAMTFTWTISSSGGGLDVSTPSAAAESRAARGDLALTWSNELGSADISRLQYDTDLTTDEGLTTALLLSWFTDRRAEPDDKPPSGDDNDRRGWWADQFLEVAGDKYGSRLWLLDRSTLSNETLIKAREYLLEASAWMVEDRVVSEVVVTVDRLGKDGILITGELKRPGKDPVSFRFAHTWDHLEVV